MDGAARAQTVIENGVRIFVTIYLTYAPLRKVKSMHVAMAQEVQAILNNQGDTVAKRDECHKMADANREYVHFRWGKF